MAFRLLEAGRFSSDEVRAYRDAMYNVMEQADKLDGQALERAASLTRALQERVIGRLQAERDRATQVRDGEEKWNPFWLKRLQDAVGEVARDQAHTYGRDLGHFAPLAFDLGQDLVDGPVKALRFDFTAPRIRAADVGIAANWSPDLIRGMSDHARDVVAEQIRLSMMTGDPPQKLMKTLAGRITTDGTPFRSVQYRAELITRTEINRVHALGNQHRQLDFVRAFPDAGMKKALLVADVNGWPCEECSGIAEDGPWDIDDDDAPDLPIHPNCRCSLISIFAGVDIPDDSPTDAERDASVADVENDEGDVQEAGTSAGGEKAWDTRGRGRKPRTQDFIPTDRLLVQGATAAEAAEIWGRLGQTGLQKPPMELADSIGQGTGFTTDRVTLDVEHNEYPDGSRYTELTMRVVYGDGTDKPPLTLERTFPAGAPVVEHSASGVRDDLQRQGISKLVARNSLAEYRAAGIVLVTINAGKTVGSAVWAKFGYLPTQAGWDKARAEINTRADAMKAAGQMSPKDHRFVQSLAKLSDPRTMWDVVKQPHSDALLQNNSWQGILDLTNHEQMDRFDKYTTGGTQWTPRKK